MFFKQDKIEARKSLNLPLQGIFIGTAGALNKRRGIANLIDAYKKLSLQYDNIYLILAGPIDSSIPAENHSRIFYLGNLPHSKIPIVLNSLDIGVICNKADEFGKYCFPQKAYEMFACKIPVVAADTGAMSDLLFNYSHCLYKPDILNSLISAIRSQIEKPLIAEINIPIWADQGRKFEYLIRSVIEKNDNS